MDFSPKFEDPSLGKENVTPLEYKGVIYSDVSVPEGYQKKDIERFGQRVESFCELEDAYFRTWDTLDIPEEATSFSRNKACTVIDVKAKLSEGRELAQRIYLVNDEDRVRLDQGDSRESTCYYLVNDDSSSVNVPLGFLKKQMSGLMMEIEIENSVELIIQKSRYIKNIRPSSEKEDRRGVDFFFTITTGEGDVELPIQLKTGKKMIGRADEGKFIWHMRSVDIDLSKEVERLDQALESYFQSNE